MSKKYLLLFLPFLFSFTFLWTRYIEIEKELNESSFIGEIIVRSYTSRIDTITAAKPISINKVIDEMSYSLVEKPDSIITYKTEKTRFTNGTVFFDIRPENGFPFKIVNEKKRLAQGFWPAINDTILLVKSKNNSINLFADIDNTDYVFWSPYHNSSWNTIFFANKPFFQDTIKIKDYSSNRNEKYNQSLQQNAQRKGYQLASNYFIRIKKTDFWKTFEKK